MTVEFKAEDEGRAITESLRATSEFYATHDRTIDAGPDEDETLCPECNVDLTDQGQPHGHGCTMYADQMQDYGDEAWERVMDR